MRKRKSQKSVSEEFHVSSGREDARSAGIFISDDLMDQLAPDGMNTNFLDHVILHDMGQNIYICHFYINSMPRNLDFAKSLKPLFDFSDVTTSIYVRPFPEGKAQKTLDKKIEADQSEVDIAKDQNRARRMMQHLNNDRAWAHRIETGETKMYEVGFLFQVRALSMEALKKKFSEFVDVAKGQKIELVSCFAGEPEAFMTSGPYNTPYVGAFGLSFMLPMKWHPLDTEGVAMLYNHTTASFSHLGGVPIGRNMFSQEPILYDIYDPSHNGYVIVIVGNIGSGKSLFIKLLTERNSHFGYRFACIDTDSTGGHGEYVRTCEASNGINYELRSGTENVLNIFELDEQQIYDESLCMYRRVLNLPAKVADVKNILVAIIYGRNTPPELSIATALERLLSDCVMELYNSKGIYDGQPDSLYYSGENRRRKDLPTMSEVYLWILKHQKENQNAQHIVPYQILVDSLADCVRDLYVDMETCERVTKADFDAKNETGRAIVCFNGTKGYMDGQSTMHVSKETPFINIDLTGLPDGDKYIGQLIAINFLMEHFIKKNSENVRDASKICMIIDEAHRAFGYEPSRKFLEDQVRTGRKRNASLIFCTQNYRDFSFYKETDTIASQACTTFFFKQAAADEEYIIKTTHISESAARQITLLGGASSNEASANNRVLSEEEIAEQKKLASAHKGEMCICDGNRCVFCKVDYLMRTEAYFAETDMAKRKAMMGY